VSGGDKFVDLPCRSGGTGAPILEGGAGAHRMPRVRRARRGDHTIYVGEVESAAAGEGRPLLFFAAAIISCRGSERRPRCVGRPPRVAVVSATPPALFFAVETQRSRL